MAAWYESILERDRIPDPAIRWSIRRLLKERLKEESGRSLDPLIGVLKSSAIAVNTPDANRQHYEVPANFFGLALGVRRKYSCCYWPEGVTTLDQAEERSLAQIVERAQIEDGQQILELGCGWGSLSLYLAEKFPDARILSVSNSNSQSEYIEKEALRRNLTNLSVRTADMNVFDPAGTFDRVVSIEMFEHMRNYQELFRRIATWMKPNGLLFVHIFCHRRIAYLFEDRGDSDWMARHFFSGGIMPSDNLFDRFQHDVRIVDRWQLDGAHYQKTSEAWLENLDAHRDEALKLFAEVYGATDALKWLVRWRIFFMACAELWGYRGGSEWIVSHYLFQPAR